MKLFNIKFLTILTCLSVINFTYSDNSSVNAAEAQPVITEKSIAEITEANPVVLDETTDESVQLDATKATPKVADALLYPEERDELLAKIIEGIDSRSFSTSYFLDTSS